MSTIHGIRWAADRAGLHSGLRARAGWLPGALLLALGLAGHPTAAPGQTVPAEHVRSFFGAVHLGSEEMPFASRLGVSWSRHGISWPTHEPARGEYDFSSADSLVATAREHGVRLMPVLGNVPRWASTAPAGAPNARHHPFPADSVGAWVEYVRRVVERYPDVEYFEVWNEPNIDWFLAAERNHEVYVDRVLIPAAEVIHAHGARVVAPSYTLEWPLDEWPPERRPARHQRDLASAIRDVDRWLSYHEAWRHVDVLSVHYSKGDANPVGVPSGDVLMPFYDHVYEKWVRTGRLEGIWNTEEGLTATEAGTAGFVALEPWERPPYARWVPRYTLPVLHWALRHGWEERDAYKVFWYHVTTSGGGGTLSPTNLLEREDGGPAPSPTGRALATAAGLFRGADSVGAFRGDLRVGFGLSPNRPEAANRFPPYPFRSYGFRVDRSLVVAAWLDLPGLETRRRAEAPVEVEIGGAGGAGIPPGAPVTVTSVDYRTGEESAVDRVGWSGDGVLRIRMPEATAPVLYLRVRARDGSGPGEELSGAAR